MGGSINYRLPNCRRHHNVMPSKFWQLDDHKRKTLIFFQLALGLKANFHKSSMIRINMEKSWIQQTTISLIFKIGPYRLLIWNCWLMEPRQGSKCGILFLIECEENYPPGKVDSYQSGVAQFSTNHLYHVFPCITCPSSLFSRHHVKKQPNSTNFF